MLIMDAVIKPRRSSSPTPIGTWTLNTSYPGRSIHYDTTNEQWLIGYRDRIYYIEEDNPGGTWTDLYIYNSYLDYIYECWSNGSYWGISGSDDNVFLYASTSDLTSWTDAHHQARGTCYGTAYYGNGYWVDYGQNTAPYYINNSSPAGTWTQASATPGYGRRVRYHDGYWCYMYGQTTGTDLMYANSSSPDATYTSVTLFSGSSKNGLFNNGDYWVAVGYGGEIKYINGAPSGTWSSATSGTTQDLYSVVYGNGYWVAVGAGGTIIYKSGSDPSGSWSSATSGSTSYIYDVYFSDGHFAAAGSDGLFYK